MSVGFRSDRNQVESGMRGRGAETRGGLPTFIREREDKIPSKQKERVRERTGGFSAVRIVLP